MHSVIFFNLNWIKFGCAHLEQSNVHLLILCIFFIFFTFQIIETFHYFNVARIAVTNYNVFILHIFLSISFFLLFFLSSFIWFIIFICYYILILVAIDIII